MENFLLFVLLLGVQQILLLKNHLKVCELLLGYAFIGMEHIVILTTKSLSK